MTMLTDQDASMNQRNHMAGNMKNLIIPLMEGAATLLKNAAKDVAPILSVTSII